MARGENTANHPNRQVGRDAFAAHQTMMGVTGNYGVVAKPTVQNDWHNAPRSDTPQNVTPQNDWHNAPRSDTPQYGGPGGDWHNQPRRD